MSHPVLRLGERARQDLRDALAADGGLEVCGFLLGERCGPLLVAHRAFLARNSSPTAGSFSIADAELGRARRAARRAGLELVALFHSHPSGSRALSLEDREALARSPWPWVLVTRSAGTDVAVDLFASGARPTEASASP